MDIKKLIVDLKQEKGHMTAEQASAALETKANEVVHTGNTGFGAELIPTEVQGTDYLDMIPSYSRLLQVFKGNQGSNLDKVVTLPAIGEVGLYSTGTEWTTGGLYGQVAQGTDKLPTGKVTITQYKYKASVDISDEELRFSSVDQLEAKVKERLLSSAGRTVDAAIINGDTETGVTGNVNSDDAAPTAGSYYLNSDGLRKVGLVTNSTDAIDLATLEWADYVDMVTAMGHLGANPEDLVFITNLRTYNASMKLTEFKDASQNGAASTINRLAKTNILGSDVFVNRDVSLTEADGKVSATPANNTKGQIILAHKNAVQYGFNGSFTMETIRVPGEGIQIIGYFYFGYTIANKLAGQTEPSVVVGYNATV